MYVIDIKHTVMSDQVNSSNINKHYTECDARNTL